MGQASSGELIPLLLQFGLPLFLILLGYIAGRIIERRHIRSILDRENRLRLAIPTNLKQAPDRPVAQAFLVSGSVVIAADYYQTLGAQIKKLVGGRLGTLETLLERSRREAILRMREQAAWQGAHLVLNVRLETSSISEGAGMPRVEVLAYGTALVFA